MAFLEDVAKVPLLSDVMCGRLSLTCAALNIDQRTVATQRADPTMLPRKLHPGDQGAGSVELVFNDRGELVGQADDPATTTRSKAAGPSTKPMGSLRRPVEPKAPKVGSKVTLVPRPPAPQKAKMPPPPPPRVAAPATEVKDEDDQESVFDEQERELEALEELALERRRRAPLPPPAGAPSTPTEEAGQEAGQEDRAAPETPPVPDKRARLTQLHQELTDVQNDIQVLHGRYADILHEISEVMAMDD